MIFEAIEISNFLLGYFWSKKRQAFTFAHTYTHIQIHTHLDIILDKNKKLFHPADSY